MNTQRTCYGKMFPDVIHLVDNEEVTGRVFGYRVDRPGVAVTNRSAAVNKEEWQRCVECPEFEGCYRLSIGTVLVELAIKS